MEFKTLNDVTLRRYLLDDVSEEERRIVEERFFQDDSIFDEMNALEDELYYDYQQNRLNSRERKIFVQKFLQSRQDVEKAEFANAFLAATAEIAGQKSKIETVSWRQSITEFFSFGGSLLQFGAAAALVLLMLGVIGLFVQNSRLQNEMASLQNKQSLEKQEQEKILAEKERRQIELERQIADEKSNAEQNENRLREIEAERAKLVGEIAETNKRINQIQPNPAPQKTQVSPPRISIATLVLSPGTFNRSNGETMSRVNLPPSAKNLQIRLLLNNKEDYKSYRAALGTLDEGVEIWKSADLQPNGKSAKKSLTIIIPAKYLQRKDYEISLVGVTAGGKTEDITTYYFSVFK